MAGQADDRPDGQVAGPSAGTGPRRAEDSGQPRRGADTQRIAG